MNTPIHLLAGLAIATALPSLASAQAANGDQLFRQRCQMCHTAQKGAPATMGPNLAGVVGRKAGSTSYAYSPAMKASAVKWDKVTLDRYLSGPARMMPGTKMAISVPDAKQRAAIIQHLATKK